jgi:hypothetical protein
MGWQDNVFQLLIVEGSGAGTGLFVYSGAPGPGNLPVLSVVSPGVTADPFGNAVVSVLELRGASGVMTITDPAVINFLSGATTTGTIKSLTAAQRLEVSSPNGLSLPAAGNNVIMDSLSFIACGSDATATVPAPWHSETLLNGWSGTFKQRRGAENEIKFQCGMTPGTVVDGTTIATLLGVTPAASQTHTIRTDVLKVSGAAFESAGLQLDTSGNVKCFGFGAAATTAAGVGFWPLDN